MLASLCLIQENLFNSICTKLIPCKKGIDQRHCQFTPFFRPGVLYGGLAVCWPLILLDGLARIPFLKISYSEGYIISLLLSLFLCFSFVTCNNLQLVEVLHYLVDRLIGTK